MNDAFDLLHVYAEASDDYVSHDHSGSTELVLRGVQSRGGPRMPMVVSVSGHTDAGALSEQLSEALVGALPHKLMASFDVDELYDYRSRRPQVTFSENRFSDMQGPHLDLFEVRDAMDRPFLMLTGDEPDFQWERVVNTVTALVERLEVSLVVVVDALGLPAPHTRPVGVTAHGNRRDLIEGISTWSPSAQIEAGLVQMLEMNLDAAGHDVVGYTLHVPHYLASGKYPQVAVAALEYTGAACELMLPSDELREAARMVDQDISRQVDQSSDVSQLVHQLEATYDKHAKPAQRSLLVKRDENVPDAEELGAAVEEFLRAQPEEAVGGSAEPEPPTESGLVEDLRLEGSTGPGDGDDSGRPDTADDDGENPAP